MLVFGSRAHGLTRRRAIGTLDVAAYKSEWMEAGDDPVLSPTIFLIKLAAHAITPPHFHGQNQFQLFVGGGGTIGPSQLQPVTVHYAGAHTSYGPLVAGPEGIRYFTIRPVCEAGAILLTEAREKMVHGPKRHATSAPLRPLPPAELAALKTLVRVEAIAQADDGLGATLVRVPPGAAADIDFPPTADGAFMVVLAGSIRHAGGELHEWESLFASSRDELPELTAGLSGAEVVYLFTPAKAQAYL